MPLSGDRNGQAPRFVGVKPRRRFTVTDADGTHSLDPQRDRVSIHHDWVRERPELWEPVEREAGQNRKVYERAVSRTRAELASICGRVASQLERTGTTRTVDPGRRQHLRPLRLP